MRPCLITSVVKARIKAFRWSAGRPSFFSFFPWRMEREVEEARGDEGRRVGAGGGGAFGLG